MAVSLGDTKEKRSLTKLADLSKPIFRIWHHYTGAMLLASFRGNWILEDVWGFRLCCADVLALLVHMLRSPLRWPYSEVLQLQSSLLR